MICFVEAEFQANNHGALLLFWGAEMSRAREIYKVTLADLQRDLKKNGLPIPTLILNQVMTSLTSTCKFLYA